MAAQGASMDEMIKFLLALYPLEELFEVLDITPERVLEILIEEGHVDTRVIYNGQDIIEEASTTSSSTEPAGEGVEG